MSCSEVTRNQLTGANEQANLRFGRESHLTAFGEMRALHSITVTLKRGFALATGTGKGRLRSTLSVPPKLRGLPPLPL
jgi:hypothetical protein